MKIVEQAGSVGQRKEDGAGMLLALGRHGERLVGEFVGLVGLGIDEDSLRPRPKLPVDHRLQVPKDVSLVRKRNGLLLLRRPRRRKRSGRKRRKRRSEF